jgi:hypothetical protein
MNSGELFFGAMDAGHNRMKQMSKFGTGSRVRFLMVMFCFLFPTVLCAEASYSESAIPAKSQNTSSPFKISKKSKFHCAEVDKPVIGSQVSHEITIDSKRVKRCLYKQLGSRLNECKKLRIENATVDQIGLVTLDTEKGPVRFSAQDIRSNEEGKPRRVLVWTWPDTDMKYLCTALSSRL